MTAGRAPMWSGLVLVLVLAMVLGVSLWRQTSRAARMEAEVVELRRTMENLRQENQVLQREQVQADELARLRRENQEIHRLRNEVRQLREDKATLATSGQAAQSATSQAQNSMAQLQQQLQMLTAQNQQLTAQLQADQASAQSLTQSCMSNLRILEGAKDQFALENRIGVGTQVTPENVLPYLKDNQFLQCPAGGAYNLNAIGVWTTCSIPGHAIQ